MYVSTFTPVYNRDYYTHTFLGRLSEFISVQTCLLIYAFFLSRACRMV